MGKMTYIFGAGMRAREIKRLLRIDGKETCAFIVDEAYKTADEFDGTPIMTTEQFLSEVKPEEAEVYVGVGMPRMNRIREGLFDKFHSYGFRFETYISARSNVFAERIGEGCTIFPGVNIGFGTTIGDGVHFEMGVTVSHDCRIEEYCFFAPGCTLCGDITVERGCFIGANSTVRNSVKVSKYTLVGAGAYVSVSTSPFDVILPGRSKPHPTYTSEYYMNKK